MSERRGTTPLAPGGRRRRARRFHVLGRRAVVRGRPAATTTTSAAFARAPVGCETTLDFDRSGEFVLYIETTGQVDGIGGDCDVTGGTTETPTGSRSRS